MTKRQRAWETGRLGESKVFIIKLSLIEVKMLRLNRILKVRFQTITFFLLCVCLVCSGIEKNVAPKFRVIAFYTAKNDKAHISFVHEANRWFNQIAARYNFTYDSTNNW